MIQPEHLGIHEYKIKKVKTLQDLPQKEEKKGINTTTRHKRGIYVTKTTEKNTQKRRTNLAGHRQRG
jgi:hypothetical protein